jgi:hypothetical protein
MTSRDHMLKALAMESEMERTSEDTLPGFTFPTYADFAARRAAHVDGYSSTLYKRLSKEVHEAMSVATESLPGSLVVHLTFECTELLNLGVDRGKQVANAAASRLLNDLQPLGWNVSHDVYNARGSNLVFVRIQILEPDTKK